MSASWGVVGVVTGVDGEVLSVARVIGGCRFTYAGEHQLQEGIAVALAAAGLPVRREVRLSAADRIDLVVGRVGVEVKLAGAPAGVLAQLRRYAAAPRIAALVLVTTRAGHRALPERVGGKPLRVVYLGGAG